LLDGCHDGSTDIDGSEDGTCDGSIDIDGREDGTCDGATEGSLELDGPETGALKLSADRISMALIFGFSVWRRKSIVKLPSVTVVNTGTANAVAKPTLA